MSLKNCIFLALAVCLCACSGDPRPKLDGRKVLDQIKGPEISTMEVTMQQSAQKAMQEEDFKRAGQFYQQLGDKYPDKVEYRLGRAEALRRSGEFDLSVKTYDGILEKDPHNIDAMEGKGLALMGKGEYPDAGRNFEQVIAADPKRWRSLNAAGVLFAMKNMNDEAMAYYEQALKASPDNPSVLNNVGITLALDKQYDKAIEAMQRATRQVSTESAEKKRLDLNLALVYAVAGKLSDAEATARLHLTGAPLLNNLGYYAHVAKNDEVAKSYLNMALTKSPTYYGKAWRNLDDLSQKGSGHALGATGNKPPVTVKKGTPGSSQKEEEKREEKKEEKAEAKDKEEKKDKTDKSDQQ